MVNQFDFFLSPVVSFQINFAKNQNHCNMLARLCNFYYVVYVKSSDKLLNYLMLVQALTEVKTEMLKNHDFPPW